MKQISNPVLSSRLLLVFILTLLSPDIMDVFFFDEIMSLYGSVVPSYTADGAVECYEKGGIYILVYMIRYGLLNIFIGRKCIVLMLGKKCISIHNHIFFSHFSFVRFTVIFMIYYE